MTKPGLPLAVGEPAINPVPRDMMRRAVAEVAGRHGGSGDVLVEISVERGEELARHTWNPRLGILGGLSILGTTGIVVPYSCSAWIDSIRRGIDVARAAGHRHVAACTGSTSERVATELYGLPEDALLDMGDFAGAVLKYLRRHPIPRLTVAGGIGKLTKLANGHLDLHSGRSQVDFHALAELVAGAGGGAELVEGVRGANTALDALRQCQAAGLPLGDMVAQGARNTATEVLRPAPVAGRRRRHRPSRHDSRPHPLTHPVDLAVVMPHQSRETGQTGGTQLQDRRSGGGVRHGGGWWSRGGCRERFRR